MTGGPRTLFDKLWAAHEVVRREDGASLLWVDRHLVHEGSHHAFRKIAERGLRVAHPELTFAVADHYAPTRRGAAMDPKIVGMMETLAANCAAHGVSLYGLDDPRQGIVHVIGPEQGLTLPGLLVTCGDSHTSTHGALGAMAFGIGATEVAHVLATQSVWQVKPRSMRIRIDGRLGPGVGAKDLALGWIARLGADGAGGHAVEYAGAVRMSTANAVRAGLEGITSFAQADIGDLAPPEGPQGLVIVNPPYGTRIGNRKLLFALHARLGAVLKERFGGWRVGLVTSDEGLARATGLPLGQPGPFVPHGGLKVRLFRTAALR